MLGPTLETDRLLLRPPQEEDLDGWAALLGDEETGRFVGGPVARPAAWRSMATIVGHWALRGFGMFSMIEKGSGRWIGWSGPHLPEDWPGTEVGWSLRRDAWGKGYATEGAARAMDWAFDHLGWDEVIHCIDPENTGSVAVAKRLGSTNRGPGRLPPPFHEFKLDIWGQSRDEWKRRN